MCGICGVLSLDGVQEIPAGILHQMMARQAHRGPDDQGDHLEPGVGLGFCRLAIIDLSPMGHQPMTNEDGSVWLVFNGEIYNYQDMIPALERAGHQFRSKSDSEVIIHAYEEWGAGCLEFFNGMFAFVIWDRRKHTIFMARDRLGVKPLYYWSDGHQFVFGSELKTVVEHPAVPHQINQHAVQSFFTYEYVAGPESIFSGVRKLPAATYLEFQLDGSYLGTSTDDWQPRTYWDVQFNSDQLPERSVDDYAAEFREVLRAAVSRRLISDVPLGAFLSGGLDSSIIVALMSELSPERPKTFSIGFGEQTFNELSYAEIVARHFNTDHHVEVLQPQAQDLIDTVANYLDEPFADASALPTYLVSKVARQKVTVALSGDGGDELFAGYDWYRAQRMAAATLDRMTPGVRTNLRDLIYQLRPGNQKKGLNNILRRLLDGASKPSSMQHIRWQSFSTEDEMHDLFVDAEAYLPGDVDPEFLALFKASGSNAPLDQQQYADIKRYLADDILYKVDRMSMAVSLEARGPFLDYTLVEFAAQVPRNLRLNGLSGKYLMKYAMRDMLPPEILSRPKLGFNIPYKNWLRHELRDLMGDLLDGHRLARQGIFRPQTVQRLMAQHLAGTHDHAHRLWPLVMFQLWEERFSESRAHVATPFATSASSSIA